MTKGNNNPAQYVSVWKASKNKVTHRGIKYYYFFSFFFTHDPKLLCDKTIHLNFSYRWQFRALKIFLLIYFT